MEGRSRVLSRVCFLPSTLVLLGSDSEASQGQAQVSGDWGWVVSPAPALFPDTSWMPEHSVCF